MTAATAAPSEKAVELVGVEKRFPNGTLALESLDLAIDRGRFTCFVGPSGCGKSTALRLIAELSKPTAGDVRWAGSSEHGAHHEVGFVFQEPTLMPWRRVWDNVYLPLQLRGQSRAAARDTVDEALTLVGLEDFGRSYPRELSGGMKMRVSIARALVTQPDVLLMDEPFAALDEMTRTRLNDDLLRLWDERRWTIVFVTHSIYESVYLAGRIVVMAPRPGRVVADVAVDAPYPRDESFRRSEEYGERCAEVSRRLADAHAEASL